MFFVFLSLSCEKEENSIYEGDVLLKHQSDVEMFALSGFVEINGNLTIYGGPDSSYTDRIDDLSPLENLKRINGDYRITGDFMPNNEEFGIENVE